MALKKTVDLATYNKVDRDAVHKLENQQSRRTDRITSLSAAIQQMQADGVVTKKEQKKIDKNTARIGKDTAALGAGNQTYQQNYTPTGVVYGQGGNTTPGQGPLPFPEKGDTITSGYVQKTARGEGLGEQADFVTPSGYQPPAPGGQGNPFGLSNKTPGQSTAIQFAYQNPDADSFSAGQAVNMARESDNLIMRDEATRRQQAIDQYAGGQDDVRNLYGQALADSQKIGAQAMGRIGDAATKAKSASESNLISRGLGNSTVVGAMNQGIERTAEDNRQGVDEQMAQRSMGLRTMLAGTEQQKTGNIANALQSGGARGDSGAQIAAGSTVYKPDSNPWGAVGQIGGALIGSLIAPGVGTAIGGSLGGAAGGAAGAMGKKGG